jgi:GxxExxY protein
MAAHDAAIERSTARNFNHRCTPMHTDKTSAHDRLSECVIGCAFRVINTLGTGFLEKVYENALAHEVRKAGLAVAQQQAVTVLYDGIVVGEYVVDLLIEGTLVIELKTVKALDSVHAAQCLNYLEASGLRFCLLLNFGKPHLEIRRFARGP